MTVRVIFGICSAALAAGCGGGHGGVLGASTRLCAKLTAEPNVALAAVVKRPLVAFREPGHGSIARFGLLNANGVDTVFAVRSETCDATWLRVQLPLRPNGATGWVRADHVKRVEVKTRIVVDLSERRVTFFKSGRPVDW